MSPNKGTILAVDDDSNALALLVGVLIEEGYKVQPADSGRLALVSLAAQTPDLILLDLRMPGMDGFEVCRRIKQTEGGHRVPIIFLSASRDVEEWVEALALGAVDFISKPFRREELIARVRTHVELGRLRAGLESLVAQRTAELRTVIDQLQSEVTERRRAEQAARESEGRFRQIANAAPVIIWMSDASANIDFCNDFAIQFTGRTMEQLQGRNWSAVVHPEDLKQYQTQWLASVAARQDFQTEIRIRRADGEYRWMFSRAIPRLLRDGGFAGHIGILLDVTDVKRAQEQIFASRNLENLRVLSAGIAHDFNTLVGSIFGETDLALSDMYPDSPGYDNVKRILGIAKRAADIVRLLGVYADARCDRSEPELIDVSALVQEVVPHLKASFLHRPEILTSLDPHLPSIRANSHQIRQVILNVIVNAFEALAGKKGTVTIGTSTVEMPEGRFVKFEVSDTGDGMTEEVRIRIFDPYFSTKSLGRGLGLAAVHGIIQAHGGRVETRSKPGGGSTFEILLPVKR